MNQSYWLVKSEPGDYSFADLERDKQTAWTGVRNFEARNHLRGMKPGDLVLVYHTGAEKRVVGLAKVVRAAYPDPTAKQQDFSAVDLAPVKALARPVSLAELKGEPELAGLLLTSRARLSVMPVSAAHFRSIARLAKTRG